jgi:hypothetical protein
MIVFFVLKRHERKDELDGNLDPDRLDPERFGGNATRSGATHNIGWSRGYSLLIPP